VAGLMMLSMDHWKACFAYSLGSTEWRLVWKVVPAMQMVRVGASWCSSTTISWMAPGCSCCSGITCLIAGLIGMNLEK
jgi:hypothetical protein